MTCQVLMEFKAREDRIDAMLQWLRAILPDTRSREGCVSAAVSRNQDDPTNFAFVEQWQTRGHYERYFEWRRQSGVLDELATMVDGEASFRFYDYVGL